MNLKPSSRNTELYKIQAGTGNYYKHMTCLSFDFDFDIYAVQAIVCLAVLLGEVYMTAYQAL